MKTNLPVRYSLTLLMLFIAARTVYAQVDTFFICVDPGHGGSKPGATGHYTQDGQTYDVLEKGVNLQVAKLLSDSLAAIDINESDYAFVVELTRDTDIDLSLLARADKSNTQDNGTPGDIFISVHHNGADTNAHGTEVFWCSEPTTSAGHARENNNFLAKRIYASLQDIFDGFHQRWKKDYDSCYTVLAESRAASSLSEAEFVTYPSAAALFDAPDSAYSKNEAGAIAWGILHYIYDDPCITISSNVTNLEFIVEDSVYIGTYYGNWFVGEEYNVILPTSWGYILRHFCKWEDDLSGANRTIYCCYEDNYNAVYSLPYLCGIYNSPGPGDMCEEGDTVRIEWTLTQYPYETVFISVWLTRDGWNSRELLLDSRPNGPPTSGGSFDWVVQPPFSVNCAMAVAVNNELTCVEVADTTDVFSIIPPPTPVPSGLYTATCGTDFRIQFFWDPVADIDSYLVYRDNTWIATKPAGFSSI